jgi:hypothetical protein
MCHARLYHQLFIPKKDCIINRLKLVVQLDAAYKYVVSALSVIMRWGGAEVQRGINSGHKLSSTRAEVCMYACICGCRQGSRGAPIERARVEGRWFIRSIAACVHRPISLTSRMHGPSASYLPAGRRLRGVSPQAPRRRRRPRATAQDASGWAAAGLARRKWTKETPAAACASPAHSHQNVGSAGSTVGSRDEGRKCLRTWVEEGVVWNDWPQSIWVDELWLWYKSSIQPSK